MTDDEKVTRAQVQLQRAAKALEQMAPAVAAAKQIKEYDSDRRKQALSRAVAPLLEAGEGVGAAEHKARASQSYAEALMELGGQHLDALATIEEHDAHKVLWESARSLLSVEKAKIGLL